MKKDRVDGKEGKKRAKTVAGGNGGSSSRRDSKTNVKIGTGYGERKWGRLKELSRRDENSGGGK